MGFRHHGIPQVVKDANGKTKGNPLLLHAFDGERAAKTKMHGILDRYGHSSTATVGSRPMGRSDGGPIGIAAVSEARVPHS